MRFVLLGIGSLLAILFIVFLSKGRKYEYLVMNLDSNQFPLNEIYSVGFVWSTGKLFKLKGKTSSSLKTEASLLYEPQYAEYYANVVWAQTLTLVHFFLTMTFLCAGILFNVDRGDIYECIGCGVLSGKYAKYVGEPYKRM